MRKQVDLKEHQQIMFKILCDFADFCDANNWTYFLDAGTLLGAVRQKGFIPWDNDLDVCMVRTDYDQLLEKVKENQYHINDELIVELPNGTTNPFIKIANIKTELIEYPDKNPMSVYIYIDVFPKDAIPDRTLKTKVFGRFCRGWSKAHWFCNYSIHAWKKQGTVKRTIARISDKLIKDKDFAIKMLNRKIHRYIKRHPWEKCVYATTLVNGEYDPCPKECFESYEILEFEGREFKAPAHYEKWLSILYGKNYIIPPPPEKRKTHRVLAYWRDSDGTE